MVELWFSLTSETEYELKPKKFIPQLYGEQATGLVIFGSKAKSHLARVHTFDSNAIAMSLHAQKT